MQALDFLVPRIFRQAWERYGKPALWAIRPLADWSLPAGFAYDRSVDAITDAAGTVLPNPESYWAGDYVYIVPIGQTADLRAMVAAGVVPSGMVDVKVLSADLATVRAAHAVQINGDWYDVLEVAQAPVGVAGVWGTVRLRRRS